MEFQFESVEKLKQINDVRSWLANLGLRVDSNRYVTAQNVLARGVEKGEIDQDEMIDFQWALQELDDFLFVHELLNKESASVVSTLEKTLKGALLAVDEVPPSAGGRNFLFELVAAAHFIRQGMRVKFEGEADFVIDVNGTYVFVECKRGINIDSLLKDAFKQIRRRCSEQRELPTAGIAVVCTTPIIIQDTAHNGPVIAPRELIQSTMEETASKFNFSSFEKYCPPGLGVFTHCAIPFWEQQSMNLTVLRRNDFYPLRDKNDPLLRYMKKHWN